MILEGLTCIPYWRELERRWNDDKAGDASRLQHRTDDLHCMIFNGMELRLMRV